MQQLTRWLVPPGAPRGGALWLRAPRPVTAAVWGAAAHRPPGSPSRKRLLTLAVRVGFDALNRGRIDLFLRLYDPACEIHLDEGRPPDQEPSYSGHEGHRVLLGELDRAGTANWVPEEVLDMGGPCFAVLTGVTVTGNISGAAPPSKMAFVHTVRRGVSVRQDSLYHWQSAPEVLAAALRAA